jgi:hypothetical protein
MLQLRASVGGRELPVDLRRPMVTVTLPRSDLGLHEIFVRDTSVETLLLKGAEFDLGNIQPAAVLGRIVELQPLCKAPRFLRFERLIEAAQSIFCARSSIPSRGE